MPKSNLTGTPASALYGIGEWYGRLFESLSSEERDVFLERAARPLGNNTPLCPFRPGERCNKRGGVCTLSRYMISADGDGVASAHAVGDLITLCPERFREGNLVYRWVSEVLLRCPDPLVVVEVDFLRRPEGVSAAHPQSASAGAPDAGIERGVGRIDCVLVDPTRVEQLHWCALEVQAVYFSGASMNEDFRAIGKWHGAGVPIPAGRRRPDWRSSGPKRLMPQLQIKVPALRRWGKKTAVLVDNSFYSAMSRMDEVDDVSNCDIAWFVVSYRRMDGHAVLHPQSVHLTTLEHAVEGLTAGVPLSQSEFESRIRAKLASAG